MIVDRDTTDADIFDAPDMIGPGGLSVIDRMILLYGVDPALWALAIFEKTGRWPAPLPPLTDRE